MADKDFRNEKILFFGAGKRGRYWLRVCKGFGIVPEGILDNNHDLWGTLCGGIMVYSPDRVSMFDFEYMFITCMEEGEIAQQLLGYGVAENKIVIGNHNILNHLLYYLTKNRIYQCPINLEANVQVKDQADGEKIIIDLYNGMVLGGVELWSYDLAKLLHEHGYQGMYLSTDAAGPSVIDETYPNHVVAYQGVAEEKDKIDICVKEIAVNLPCAVICNFPQHTFWAACIVKLFYPEQIRIIAVQHSDEGLYYNAYSLWKRYIDKCMVISSCMEEKLLSYGMEQSKIGHLGWRIDCREIPEGKWDKGNAVLQIGYAGRITIRPKRIDLFFTLARILKKRNVHFQINIAGEGDYSEILRQRIQEEPFNDCMVFVGYLERKDISDFWRKQDIMVSCSEWEGHSISQSEAMAEGAVPVITDVSGARDDVDDGYNGFVVDIGDTEALAERISYLYHDRDALERMGRHAHDTIYNRQKSINEIEFWSDLLGKAWQ